MSGEPLFLAIDYGASKLRWALENLPPVRQALADGTLCWGPQASFLFLNGIAGLGGPFWKPDFASRFVGDGEPWQKAVAVVESMAFLLQANMDEIGKYLPPAKRIRVSGGVSRLDGLCRRLATVSALPVHRRDDAEATARGIGYLAAGMPAQWNNAATEEVFVPEKDEALVRRYVRWRALMREATGV